MKNILLLFFMHMPPFKEQQTFLNYFQNELGTTRTEKFLTKLDKVGPWASISKKIQRNREFSEGGVGRPRMETIKMIKILFLQGLYGLSDPEVEDKIRDRNSFQSSYRNNKRWRFCNEYNIYNS